MELTEVEAGKFLTDFKMMTMMMMMMIMMMMIIIE